MNFLNTNKLAATVLLFIFTTTAPPLIAAGADTVADQITTVQQESVYTATAPKVDVGIPRVLNLSHEGGVGGEMFAVGHKVIMRSIAVMPQLIMQLKTCPFQFNAGMVSVSTGAYTDVPGAYVNLSGSDSRTGIVQIQTPANKLESTIQKILAHPEQYGVHATLLNVQIAPMIVSDSVSDSHLLLVEASDFRAAATAIYNPTIVRYTTASLYSAFRGYAELMHKTNPGKSLVIHTGLWGLANKNNPQVTAVMQMVAAHIAGIDRLVFHIDPSNAVELQVVNDALTFVQSQDTNSVDTIMTNLLQVQVSSSYNSPQ